VSKTRKVSALLCGIKDKRLHTVVAQVLATQELRYIFETALHCIANNLLTIYNHWIPVVELNNYVMYLQWQQIEVVEVVVLGVQVVIQVDGSQAVVEDHTTKAEVVEEEDEFIQKGKVNYPVLAFSEVVKMMITLIQLVY
jgi:hypothetical protein